MKPGDLVRIRDSWRPYGSNAKNYPAAGELVLIFGLLNDEIYSIFKVLSSKGVVNFHVSFLEVIDEAR
jgi:hypothetical protein